ncbi:LysR family transcriptional regulator [Massilia sp. IC2-477]|uniref:LysR family transcriptional regulator n=1 Tax=Massilia sp. IC2-477 TaxID=2887198 RepID=UPI001D105573|nr:LysR family transcriptional regulator [Massilia sp. IC2-477]MCC2954151.1 LysR family transcriptional regulator [Massilia sp. IC2-477]
MINYKHLHYFHAVATQGTVTRAAEQLHVTAQAISMQLQVLEDQLGEELFQKKGRVLELTEAGKTVLRYTEQIFDLGNELEQAVRRGVFKGDETLRVGVCDMIAKNLVFRLLQPARDAGLAMRLICREGRFEDLVVDLTAHKLDLVISDQGLPTGGAVRGHTRLLGSSTLTVFGHPDLCKAWPGRFPECLRNAPFLLPGQDAAIHSQLGSWFETHGLRPITVGEFDDGALLKSFACAGTGFMVAPTVLSSSVQAENGLVAVGTIDSIVEHFYAVSVERREGHPAVRRILDAAGRVFTQDPA